jgi:hypothetical protein
VKGVRLFTCALAAIACLGAEPRCATIYDDPDDPMLHWDVADPDTFELLELPPGAPWIRPGPDGELGTDDDDIWDFIRPDVDLVVRTGIGSFSGPVPPPTGAGTPPTAVAEPFGEGTPILFVVAATDGNPLGGVGSPVAPPSLVDVPVLLIAFADLDGDGAIGITLLDGDPLDVSLEEAELEPVGRRLVLASGGRASGEIFVSSGGPPGAEPIVMVGAVAYAGPFDPGHFGGEVPNGPMVMTQLPFLPETDPVEVIDGNLPRPADPMGLAGVEVKNALEPDPTVPAIGESFTIPVDGSAPSIDTARAQSGAFARFGLAAEPEAATYRNLPSRPLRPGLDSAGGRAAFEILQHAFLADDGGTSGRSLRVVALDRLGNVTTPPGASAVTVLAEPPVRITAPDTDGDFSSEELDLADARGAVITIDDDGGVFDGADRGGLLVEFGAALFQLDVWLPDPDVDDSGTVDAADANLVRSLDRLRVGDPGYDFRADLTGDGRIDDDDVDAVEAENGRNVAVP